MDKTSWYFKYDEVDLLLQRALEIEYHDI